MTSLEQLKRNIIREKFFSTFRKFTYYVEGGVTYRNVYNMTGLRLIFDSRAKGRQLAVEDILLQIATMIATLRTAYYLYDFIIYNFFKGIFLTFCED